MRVNESRQREKCVKTIFQLCLLFLLAACAAPQQSHLAKRLYTPIVAESEIVQWPELNVESNAEVGQSMISTAKRTPSPAVRLNRDVVHSGTNLGHQFKLTIPAGYLLLSGQDTEGRYFEASKPLNFQAGAATVTVKGGIFVPNDKAQSTEIYWLAPSSKIPLNDPSSGMSLAVIEDYAHYDKDSFKRELVYSGISQKTISILYREFIDDMARPAFSQELKYDLSQGETIGFKGARFQVIKANNVEIRYKVMKSLD